MRNILGTAVSPSVSSVVGYPSFISSKEGRKEESCRGYCGTHSRVSTAPI